MKKLLIILFMSITLSFVSGNQILPDLTQYVNPFIGTGGHGHTYPGASLPFGFVQLSPDTRLEGWDGCSGYHYSDSVIYGFSHTHLSGTGVPEYCDILIMPTVGKINFINTEYSSAFSHKNESASPGYYSVYLDKWKVKAELTSTKRAGFHKYTFPESKEANFIIDLKHRDVVLDSYLEFVSNNEIRGLRRSRYWAKDQYVYFVMQFSKPFTKHGITVNDTLIANSSRADGKNVKSFVSFETDENEAINVRVGISGVSVDGALKNLNAEIPDWNFDKIKKQAKEAWNKELGKIIVEDGTNDQKTIFYTALYRSLLNPNIYTDVDGQFRGTDLKIHQANGFDNYTVFSLWDTYRAEHPLLTIIDQKRTNDFINTFLAEHEYGGMLPVWELSGNETFCMIGYHSIPVIVDAYLKGIRNFDIEKVYEAMKDMSNRNWLGLESYKNSGCVLQDKEHESVSKTLEYTYDDWCISQIAKALGKNDDYNYYINRAQYYKNIFDPSTGFMRAKINGGWYEPFDPTEVNNNYTEANSWQYSFYVPQDISGLAKLQGGKEKLAMKLDELFTTETELSGREQVDITGLIGQYAHGNEPSHQIAYMYNYLGQSWKTQQMIHKIVSEFYKNSPDGLIGNEDCGQMSAWYVLSAMGFYPVCPGSMQYAIGTPVFEKVTINLENGKKFVIKSENVSASNYYIHSASLNKNNYTKSYLLHSDIMNGGEINFIMGNSPDKTWGNKDEDVPVSTIESNNFVMNPVIVSQSRTFKNSQTIEIISPQPGCKILYSTDDARMNANATLYTQSFTIDNTVTIQAYVMDEKGNKSFTVEAKFYKIPEGRSISIKSQYSNQYTAGGPDGLIDMIRGEKNWRLGGWQGYQGQDFEAIVDLGKNQEVHKFSAGFLQDVRSWIWMPVEVSFMTSKEGINFELVSKINNDVPSDVYDSDITTKDFSVNVNHETRFIKVVAKSFGKIPPWHPGFGSDSWIFVDEIMVE